MIFAVAVVSVITILTALGIMLWNPRGEDSGKKDAVEKAGVDRISYSEPKEDHRKLHTSFWKVHPFIFYALMGILLLFALNVALLLPHGMIDLVYQVEQYLARFALQPYFSMLGIILVSLITLSAGWFLLPMVYIPETGEKWIYTHSWTDGHVRYFSRLFHDYDVAFPCQWAEKDLFKWTCKGAAELRDVDSRKGIITFQSRNIEVSKALEHREQIEFYQDKIIELEDMMRKGDIALPREFIDVIADMYRMARQ